MRRPRFGVMPGAWENLRQAAVEAREGAGHSRGFGRRLPRVLKRSTLVGPSHPGAARFDPELYPVILPV
jgi:hypothetical protein